MVSDPAGKGPALPGPGHWAGRWRGDVRSRRYATSLGILAAAALVSAGVLTGRRTPSFAGSYVLTTLVLTAVLWLTFETVASVGVGRAVLSAVALLGFFLATWTAVWAGVGRDAACFGTRLTTTDAAYFATTTLTTTGFGDLQAHSQSCRRLVTYQMLQNFALTGSLLVITGDAVTALAVGRQGGRDRRDDG